MTVRSRGMMRLCAAVGVAAAFGWIWPTSGWSQEGVSDLERARQLTKTIKSWRKLSDEDLPEDYCARRREARALVDKLKQDDASQYRTSSLRDVSDHLLDAEAAESSSWEAYEDEYGYYDSDDPCPPPGIAYIRDKYGNSYGIFAQARVPNWTGFYLGVNGGGAIGRSRWDFDDGSTGNFQTSGAMFGATAGYNWQKGPWVAGVEAAVDWTSIAGSSTVNCFVNCRTADTFIAMLNGRVGYAAGSFLAFVSGGVAVGDVKLDIGTVSASDDTRTGWNVGGGVEYKFMPDWSAKVQYNFVQFGTGSCGVGCGGARVPLQQNLLLLGINRHLF